MSFKPRSTHINDFFDNNYVSVPPYQRSYTWEQEHIDKLLDDIRESFDSSADELEPYFIGTVIMVPLEDDAKTVEIVDGQQRLTTLFLLLGALACRSGSGQSLDTFSDTFVHGFGKGRHRFINEMSDETASFFKGFSSSPKDIIAGLADLTDAQKIHHHLGLELILNWLGRNKDAAKDSNFFKYVHRKVEFISIEAANYGNAVDLFERINNDGKPLATGDLLKNYFIKGAKDVSVNGKKLICRDWDSIEKFKKKGNSLSKAVIGAKDGIDGFIQKACACLIWPENETVPTKSKIFIEIKKYIKKGKAVGATEKDASFTGERFLKEIKTFAEGCEKLFTKAAPRYLDNTSGPALARLMQFPKTPDWVVKLVLAVPKNNPNLTLAGRELLCSYIEIVALMMALDRNSKDMAKRVQPYCVKLRNTNDEGVLAIGQAMLADKNLVRQSSVEFSQQLTALVAVKRNTTDSAIAKYLLLMLDNWLALKVEPSAAPDNEALTLEHILPQSLGDARVGQLGNLCLLKSRGNSKAQADSFEKKLPVYRHSNTMTARLLAAGVEGIPARTKKELEAPELRRLWERIDASTFSSEDVAERTKAIVAWLCQHIDTLSGSNLELADSSPVAMREEVVYDMTILALTPQPLSVNRSPIPASIPAAQSEVPALPSPTFRIGNILAIKTYLKSGQVEESRVTVTPGKDRTKRELGLLHPFAKFLLTSEEGTAYNFTDPTQAHKFVERISYFVDE